MAKKNIFDVIRDAVEDATGSNDEKQGNDGKKGGLLGDILDDVIDKVKGTSHEQPKTDTPPPSPDNSGRVKAKPRIK